MRGSRRWLWLLVAAGVLCQGALNVVRPVTSYKLLALGADGATIGLVTAAYAVVPLLVALSLARLTDRRPRLLRLVQGSALVLAVGAAAVALAPDVWGVAVGTVVVGVGHLLFTITGQAAIARYSRDDDLDLGFGWFTASYSVGQALGPLIGGALVGAGSVEAAGRLADIDLALWAGVGLALLALPALLVPLGALPTARRSPGTENQVAARAPVGQILGVRGVGSAMFASMALLATMDIVIAFLPVVGERAGVSPVVVGWLLAVRGAAGFVSRVMLPFLSRRLSRRSLLTTSVLGAGLSLSVAPVLIRDPLLAGLLLAVGGFFLGLGQPLTMTMISTRVPIRWRSQALAVRLMGNRIGQVAFPLLAGLVVAPLGPAGAIWLTCAVLVVSGTEQLLRRDGP
ncbi:MFS transporter [Ornithinimicrobium cerasi]|uniref:MFS transporter n=1 Tax=Ornithinimicrobium cerasi TaxID=2248773 RepID=UPI000BE3E648|nr:MFS transporter [Ornithinimicrobium cerasi]